MLPKPPTIADVARAAGVSVPTVSRVLTGNIPVTEKRRAAVQQAIVDLGYRPNAAARALVSGRRSMIAVIAANTSRYGYARTIEGVEEAARASGFMVMISVIESEDDATASDVVDSVLGHAVAGVIVLDFDAPGHAVLAALPRNLPVAIAGASPVRSDSRPRAYLADHRAGRDATRYLLSLGHDTVHHIALPSSGRRGGRTAGWAEALRAAGVEAPPAVTTTWNPLQAYESAKTLARDPAVTAILAGNDEVALAVIRALAEAGRRIPDDVSVIGFDDQPIASLSLPALTTVAQDFAELGRRTFALLAHEIDGSPAPARRSVAASLVVRESTGARAAASASPVRRLVASGA